MYQGLSANWHNLITDGTTPQDFVVYEGRMYDMPYDMLSAIMGDFESGSIEIVDQAYTGQEVEIGKAPSKTCSFNLMYRNGEEPDAPRFFNACIGVRTAHENANVVYGTRAQVDLHGVTISTREDGIYYDGTLLVDGDYHSIYAVSDTEFGVHIAYCFAEDHIMVVHDNGDFETFPVTLSPFKYARGLDDMSIAVDWQDWSKHRHITFTIDGYYDTYEYCPMGVFTNNQRNAKNGMVLKVDEALDLMSALDKDCTEAIMEVADNSGASAIAYQRQIFMSLAEYCNLDYDNASVLELPIDAYWKISDLPEGKVTGRYIMQQLAFGIGTNARINREGKLAFVTRQSASEDHESAFPITESRIEIETYQESPFEVQPIDALIWSGIDGERRQYPDESGANPVVYEGCRYLHTTYFGTQAEVDEQIYDAIAQGNAFSYNPYAPLSCTILDHDPSFDAGYVWSINGNLVPVFSQTIRFNGRCTADIESNGMEQREVTNVEDYNDIIRHSVRRPVLLASSVSYDPQEINLPANYRYSDFSFFGAVLVRNSTNVVVASEFITIYEIQQTASNPSTEPNMHRLCYTNASDSPLGNVRAAGYYSFDPDNWKAHLDCTSGYTIRLYGFY